MTSPKLNSCSARLCFIGFFSLTAFQTKAAEENRPVENAAKFKLQTKADHSLPTIYLVGDSTVRVGTTGERGWGDELAPYFDLKKINVVNDAIGGRSSRTFQNEGRWDAVVKQLQKGDFVLIQFGHNDSGALNENPPVTASTRARGTIKGSGEETEEVDNILTGKHEVVHTFGWYMRKYATDAKAAGATPVICSLIPRKSWQPDGKMGRASAGYGKWAREAAAATDTLFVDLNQIIAQGYEKLGPEKVEPLFKEGPHTTVEGAQFNARSVVAGLKGLAGKPFDPYFSEAAKDIEPFTESK